MALEDSRMVWAEVTQAINGKPYVATMKFRTEAQPTIAQLGAFATVFMSGWDTCIMPIQHEQVVNQKLVVSLRNPFRSVEQTISGAGTSGADEDTIPVSQAAFRFKLYPDLSYEWYTGDPVTTRAIKRGFHFLAGIDDRYMTAGAFTIPSAMATAITTATWWFSQPLTPAGQSDYIPIIYGAEIPATQEKALRPEIWADIVDSQLTAYTWMRTRKL